MTLLDEQETSSTRVHLSGQQDEDRSVVSVRCQMRPSGQASNASFAAVDRVAGPTEIPYPTAMRIYKDFRFEAAHFLPSASAGTENARIHGHSFRARVIVEGQPDADTGYVFHFDDLTAAIADTAEALDHRMLNEIDGLAAPTLERIAIWIWSRLANRVPGLTQVEVHRDSCNEGCVYRGPRDAAQRLAAE